MSTVSVRWCGRQTVLEDDVSSTSMFLAQIEHLLMIVVVHTCNDAHSRVACARLQRRVGTKRYILGQVVRHHRRPTPHSRLA